MRYLIAILGAVLLLSGTAFASDEMADYLYDMERVGATCDYSAQADSATPSDDIFFRDNGYDWLQHSYVPNADPATDTFGDNWMWEL